MLGLSPAGDEDHGKGLVSLWGTGERAASFFHVVCSANPQA